MANTGRVRIAELVTLLRVSEPTIRKDLSVLEQQRLLRRTHGGAIAVRPQFEPSIDDRSTKHSQAKALIARACVEEVSRGDAIFLDSGTTTQKIADLLDQLHVNVLTNALDVAAAVADKPTIRHTLLGGQVRPMGGSLVGPIALDTLSRFTVNIAFIGATGLTEDGISVADTAEAQVKQAVIDRARRVIVPLDSSKFGITDFVTVCSLERIDLVITDAASNEIQEICKSHRVELRIVGQLPD